MNKAWWALFSPAVPMILEYALRFYYKCLTKKQYYVWPPNTCQIVEQEGIFAGIRPGNGLRFKVNSNGIRGDEFSEDQRYRILAVGGSTTACQYNDQENAWPYVLQRRLSEEQGYPVWVGNIGKPGLCTRERIMHLRYLLPQYPGVDMVVMLAGCIDLLRRLLEDENYDPYFLEHYETWEKKLMRGAFSDTPYYTGKYRFKTGYYGEMAISAFYRQISSLNPDRRRRSKSKPETALSRLREGRSRAAQIDQLPDLRPALLEYGANLHRIIDMAKSSSKRLLFLTQPALWKADMSPEERNLLCMGWIGGMKSGRCYSPEALNEGLRQYNVVLLEVARERGVECIDLASQIPADPAMFYDDCHFTDRGCSLAAQIIGKYLSRTAPLMPFPNRVLNFFGASATASPPVSLPVSSRRTQGASGF